MNAAPTKPKHVQITAISAAGHLPDLGRGPLSGRASRELAEAAWRAAEHGGATYLFASEESKATFLANPDRFAPQYGGSCSYCVSINMLLPVDITTAQVRSNKLYLNVNSDILEKFNADFEGSVSRANGNWPELFQEHAE